MILKIVTFILAMAAPAASQQKFLSPAAPSVPAVFYVNHSALSARYLEALLNEPALAKAYNGYYLKQKQPLLKLWQNFKKAADHALRLASLYPAAAIGANAYQSVTKTEKVLKKELSKEEKIAAEVEDDIRKAVSQVARQANASIVLNSQAIPALYIDPASDLTDRALAALLQNKKAQLQSGPTAP